jgi:hypothetical protein
LLTNLFFSYLFFPHTREVDSMICKTPDEE